MVKIKPVQSDNEWDFDEAVRDSDSDSDCTILYEWQPPRAPQPEIVGEYR